uniref:Uncharacterized protein n=1 Tax=Rhizophora mucronata TaxID=61149 RepID=A0A2P2NQK3_RHIMU
MDHPEKGKVVISFQYTHLIRCQRLKLCPNSGADDR